MLPRVKRKTQNTGLGYGVHVSAETDAIESLGASGILDVLTWAAPAAFAATDQLYDEDAGHDQGVIGYLNFKHLMDLTDRVTSNGRFALGEDVDGTGSDVLKRGITPDVFNAMPLIAPGTIVRSNYRQSPGWAAGGYRVLLQSFPFGRIDDIRWEARSDAKRRVASQVFLESEYALFDPAEFGMEVIEGIPDDDDFHGLTLVAAHAFNPVTKQFQLYVGQSKNPAHSSDDCWHWRRLLLSGGTPIGGAGLTVPPVLPGDAASTDVDDVPVRIKRPIVGEEPSASDG